MALVDGDYQFLWVDVGAVGSSSDGQIFKHSELRQKLEDGTIGFPEAAPLVPDGPLVNYFILGDDAFPVKTWLMAGGGWICHREFSITDLAEGEELLNKHLGY